jgi:hypothetical protein
MNLGIIVCPRCKKVKGIDLKHKTTKCPNCGKILTIDKLKIYYKTDSHIKLQKAVGILNAKLDGKLEEFQKTLKNLNF